MAITMYGKENLWQSETYDNAEVYKHVEYPQQTLMAPWQNDDGFDDKKTKDDKKEMLRYEDGEQESLSARFSHRHLRGLGMRMMAASKDFSLCDMISLLLEYYVSFWTF